MVLKKKVLIIGLDGFTWRIGKNLIEKKIMPNLGGLVAGGVHGTLKSVIPAETAPAWTAFQTGCRPGKTGVFTFHRFDKAKSKISLNNFSNVAVPSLWELASEAGKTIVSLNLPLSSPAPEVNGVVIPGFLCPELTADVVWPRDAYDKFIAGRGRYEFMNTDRGENTTDYIDKQIDTESVRADLAYELMDSVDWDIFFVQTQSTDITQHYYWAALDGSLNQHDQEQFDDVARLYSSLDEMIGKLTEKAGPDTLVYIVSDHGFTNMRYEFCLNVWLRQQGYLKLKQAANKNLFVNRLLNRFPGLRPLANIVKKIINPQAKSFLEDVQHHMRDLLDLSESSAIGLSSNSGLIFLNHKAGGLDKIGLAEKIKRELYEQFGPESEVPLIESIKDGREVYGEENENIRPDIVVQYQKHVWTNIGFIGEQVIRVHEDEAGAKLVMGIHDSNGVFVASGGGIKAGGQCNAEIVDITPTVMAYLGIAVPGHIDGKVLSDTFDMELRPTYCDYVNREKDLTDMPQAEQEIVEEKLAALGYL